MTMTNPPPQPQSAGGNPKFAIIGLILLLGAGAGIYFKLKPPHATAVAPHAVAAVHDAGVTGPIGPTVGTQIVLALEEPDAGQPVQTPDAGRATPHVRYVYRYIAACPGTVDGPRVTAVVRQNYGGLRECYNRQLRSNPTLRGAVTAEWVIQPNGNVGQISTAGPVARDRTFKTCFESSLSHLRFPVPRGGCAVFQQAFNFTPDGH